MMSRIMMMMNACLVGTLLALTGIATVGGCGGGENDGDDSQAADGGGIADGNGDEGSNGSPACLDACTSKSEECGAPATQAATVCSQLCDFSPTSEQVECLRNTSCPALIAAFSVGGAVCGLGQGDVDGGTPDGDSDDVVQTCIPLGEEGCDYVNGPSCCAGACEYETKRCCLGGGTYDCEEGQCCSQMQCLPDLGGSGRTVCRSGD